MEVDLRALELLPAETESTVQPYGLWGGIGMCDLHTTTDLCNPAISTFKEV